MGKGGTNLGLLPKVTRVLSKKQVWDAGDPGCIGYKVCGQGMEKKELVEREREPNSQGRNTRAALGGQAERGRGRSGSETPEFGERNAG